MRYAWIHPLIRLGLAIAVAGVAAACTGAAAFACQEDSECLQDGAAGMCQPGGFCSFPDDACESGQRFGAHAQDGLAHACVPVEGGTDTTGVPTTTEATDTTPDPSVGGVTGSTTDLDASTTGSPISGGSSGTTGSSKTTSGPSSTGTSDSGATDDSTGGTTGTVSQCIVEDSFDDGVLDDPWMPDDDLVVEQQGLLGVDMSVLTIDDFTGVWFPFEGFAGQTYTVEIAAPPPPSGGAQIIVDMNVGWGTTYSFLVEGPYLIARHHDDVEYVTLDTGRFDPEEHRFMRLREGEGVLYYETSPDTEAWTTFASIELPFGVGESWVGTWMGIWQEETELAFFGIGSASLCPAP